MTEEFKVRVDPDLREVTIAMNVPEAAGTIRIEAGVYGLHIICPEISQTRPIAMIDLWPRSREVRNEDDGVIWHTQACSIFIYSPAQRDDMLARARFYPGETVVDFESGVVMEQDPYYGQFDNDKLEAQIFHYEERVQ